jgi:hypothetical protein
LAFLYLISVFIQKLMGITVQGWATIMVAIMFLGGVQLICLGILGEYLGRIFNEVKPRPMYILEEALGGRAGNALAAAQSSDGASFEEILMPRRTSRERWSRRDPLQ